MLFPNPYTNELTNNIFMIFSFQSVMPGGVGVDEGSDEFGWVVAKDKPKYDEIFNTLEQEKGKVTGVKFETIL